jgi:alpha-methylacyl-CoA racemase
MNILSTLKGITVIDLTRLLPGPMTTRHLADLGATIIKVQSPDPAQADYAKTMGAAQDMDGDATYFYRHCNAGKEDLTLDLKQAEGRATLLDLCKTADVLIESFRPGVMTKLGLSLEALQAVNPAISLVSITGYGQHGAWASAAGHDINYMALSGQLHELCNAAGDIALPNIQYGDLLGGAMTAAFATVSAVLHSKLQGRGCWMDVSMTASLLAHNVMPLFAVQATGKPPAAGKALLNGGVPCYRAYRTGDGRQLAVGALELKFWQTFCGAVKRPDWAAQHWSLGSHEAGDATAQALANDVASLIASEPLEHWTNLFKTVDCCTTPVLRLDEALQHAANVDYGSVGYRSTVAGGAVPTVTAAMKVIA